MRSIGAYFIVSPSGLNVAASEATDVKLVRDSGSASQWDVFRRVDGRLLFRNVGTRAWLGVDACTLQQLCCCRLTCGVTESFRCYSACESRIALRGVIGLYISQNAGASITCNSESAGPHEAFLLVPCTEKETKLASHYFVGSLPENRSVQPSPTKRRKEENP